MRECADMQMCGFFNSILKDVYKVDRMSSVMWKMSFGRTVIHCV